MTYNLLQVRDNSFLGLNKMELGWLSKTKSKASRWLWRLSSQGILKGQQNSDIGQNELGSAVPASYVYILYIFVFFTYIYIFFILYILCIYILYIYIYCIYIYCVYIYIYCIYIYCIYISHYIHNHSFSGGWFSQLDRGVMLKYGGFHSQGYPHSWMVYFMENTINMNDLRVPYFRKPHIYIYISPFLERYRPSVEIYKK